MTATMVTIDTISFTIIPQRISYKAASNLFIIIIFFFRRTEHSFVILTHSYS